MTFAGHLVAAIAFSAAANVCSAQSVSAFGGCLRGTLEHDPWSVYCNPAGLAYCGQSEIAISQLNRYSIPDWNDAALSVAYIPGKRTCIGAGIEKKGFPGFGSLRFPLAASIQVNSRCAVGVRGEVINQIREQEHSRHIAAAAGSIFDLSGAIRLGIWLENLEGLLLSGSTRTRPPAVFITGLSFQPHKQFKSTVEMETALTGFGVRIGTEYLPAKNLACRLGFATAHRTVAVGVGYQIAKVSCVIALQQHPYLGLSGGVGLSRKLE